MLLIGDNVAAVSRVDRCGRSRDQRASSAMILLGRLEITSGWSHVAEHIPGVQNVTPDGISWWPKGEIASKLHSLVTGEGREQDIGDSGRVLFYTMLQFDFRDEYIYDKLKVWNAMT